MSAFITRKAGEVATRLGAGFAGGHKLWCALHTEGSQLQRSRALAAVPVARSGSGTASRARTDVAPSVLETALAGTLPGGVVQPRSGMGPGRLEPRLGSDALRPQLGQW